MGTHTHIYIFFNFSYQLINTARSLYHGITHFVYIIIFAYIKYYKFFRFYKNILDYYLHLSKKKVPQKHTIAIYVRICMS